ncbi:MAG: DUF11 domain-containing protein, partial [Anaerolineae bacterium]|nr:DUF11 domain-containing protein [Anaerolineae bacterium]
GGANLSGSSVDVSNSTFSGNQALATNPSGSASAGGLSASTTFGAVARITDTQVLSNSVVAGSTARGGGAYFLGNAHLHNVLIASNTITSGDDALGAGFYARNTNITITHSLVRGNLASGPSGSSVSGGAGFAENTNPSVVVTLTVYTSTFAENVAADAGGLATNGSKVNAIIMGSSVVSNTGYGVIFESAGAINHVQNTTIGANEDGLLNRKGTTLITHTTVASNTGVGLQRVPGSSIVVSATLVANNAPNCFGSITALGVNVSSGGCPAFSVVHPSASQLLPLASQSGEPPSYRPLSINPAVNATSCAANVDQRGVSRPQGANCDAGAVEIETTDLQIGKTATPAAVLSNGVVTYSLTVTNNGSTTATHVVVTDVVSSGAFGGLVTGTSGVSATVSGNLITFTLPNMSVGAVVTIVYTVTAPVQGVMTNTAQALALGNTDIAPGDNVMSTTVTITPVYALQLDKIQQYTVLTNVLSHTVAPGQMLTYVLVLTNTGPASAVNVALTDTLPSGVSVVGVASTPGLSCAQGVGQVTCSAASLITGTHAVTITVTAPMTSGVTLLNSAVASAAHAASVNDTTSVLVQYRALLPIVRKEP